MDKKNNSTIEEEYKIEDFTKLITESEQKDCIDKVISMIPKDLLLSPMPKNTVALTTWNGAICFDKAIYVKIESEAENEVFFVISILH